MVETWEDFRDGSHVVETAFGMPAVTEEELRARYRDYRHPDTPGRAFVALIDGRVVGTSYAVFGDVGVNLFGGSVLPEARGQGVYRALVRARWDAAAARGTPALTVQAGRMSRPICERLGFVFIGARARLRRPALMANRPKLQPAVADRQLVDRSVNVHRGQHRASGAA